MGIGTGIVADHEGTQSRQTDVVIYDPTLLAPLLYDDCTGVFPLDACLFTIEVKSRLDSSELGKAIEQARSIRELLMGDPGPRVVGGSAEQSARITIEQPKPLLVVPTLFAFSTDLVDGAKTEIARYYEQDEHAAYDPVIRMICVVGRGFWRYGSPMREHWCYSPVSENHDEVVDYLAMIVNSLVAISESRGQPKIGNYLIEGRPWERITDPNTPPQLHGP